MLNVIKKYFDFQSHNSVCIQRDKDENIKK